MHHALTLILLAQLAGETLSRLLSLPVPGPVVGMALMLGAMAASPRIAVVVRPVGEGILRHISLLFVPAAVGVVGHLDRLGTDGGPVLAALIVSTVLAIAVGALVFVWVQRLVGGGDG